MARWMAKALRQLKKSLGPIEAETAVNLVSLATDIAVMVDADGVVRDVSISSDALVRESGLAAWVGRKWIDTVTIESQPKIEQLLRDADGRPPAKWRQVNHPLDSGRPDLPVRYATMRVGNGRRVLAVGRELRSMAVLQQRLLETQQDIEREYARVRQADTRYRLLFQTAGEPILILDTSTLRVSEANPAAIALFGQSARRVIGKTFMELFGISDQSHLLRNLDALRNAGRMEDLVVRIPGRDADHVLSGSMFKQDQASFLLLRLAAADGAPAASLQRSEATLRQLVDKLPDAFVVTDMERRILSANSAFVELAQLGAPEQARGEPLDRWLGRSETEIGLLAGTLKSHGTASNFATILRGEVGGVEEVEVSAVSLADNKPGCIGFAIRTAGRRLAADDWVGRGLPGSVSQLTGLIGQMPLKSIVRETTDVIERMCIEAALEIVGDNRASAAEVLGLSRQSLYMKLRRFGIGDLGPD